MMQLHDSLGSSGRLSRAAIIAFGAIAGQLLAAPATAARMKAPPATQHRADAFESRLRTSLHQEVMLHAPPARIYRVLLSSARFAAFTGMPASIEPRTGGAASMFGGLIAARNVELVPNRRIVQAWRPVQEWAPGSYSVVRFELAPRSGGTLLIFDHTGFPAGNYGHLFSGWYLQYWDKLDAYVKRTSRLR